MSGQITPALQRDLYFEDFKPGQRWVSTGRTLTETDLQMFSMLTGDWNPIHSDAEFAKTTRYDERLLHGSFGIALAIGMLHPMGIFNSTVIAMLGVKEWAFLAPITIGMTITLELRITEVELGKSGKSGRVGRELILRNQAGEIVQTGYSDVLIMCRRTLS
ncbi:MAG: dehydratase [Sphingomonadales bacterium]|nr:MAG: dehydratase [Sphingomonadales bacterium]